MITLKTSNPPPVLAIAGSDSSGGAGVQADLKTITCLGGFGMSAITALTAQNTRGVQHIYPTTPEALREQIRSVYEDIPPAAVKIGVVWGGQQVEAIAEILQKYPPAPLVIDPVMFATSGDALSDADAIPEMERFLFPLASLLTPNLPEAASLWGDKIHTSADMERAAKTLSQKYGTAVLLKGGHTKTPGRDFLQTRDGEGAWIVSETIDTQNTHGTGCTLSSAIALYLAMSMDMYTAVKNAKAYLTKALSAGFRIGHGNGPVLHNFDYFV